jgi:AcrR family transcriptional regulator
MTSDLSATVSSGATVTPYFSLFVEGRRGEVLDAALCVFADKGYEAGTMREIARRLGVTEPALYRHYDSKEALFAELVALAGDRIMAHASAMMRRIGPENLRESLTELVQMRRRATMSSESARPVMGTLIMASPHNKAFREVFCAHFSRPMIAEWHLLVPRVDASFGLERSAQDRAKRIRAFMSLFVGYFMTSMLFDAEEDDGALVDAMMAVMGWDGTPGERTAR